MCITFLKKLFGKKPEPVPFCKTEGVSKIIQSPIKEDIPIITETEEKVTTKQLSVPKKKKKYYHKKKPNATRKT